MTETESDTTFSRPAIIRRETGSANLTDTQKDALVAAVRNPYASSHRVVSYADVNGATLQNLLWGMERGTYGMDRTDVRDYDKRLNKGTAQFKDLTVKQRASVDYLARRPDAFDELTYQEVAERISEDTGVDVHWATAHEIRKNKKYLIHDRREWYERRDRGDEIQNVADMDDDETEREERTLLEKLQAAGISEIPSENLDGLPTREESGRQGREKGLKKAHDKVRAATASSDYNGDGGDSDVSVAEGETTEGDDTPATPETERQVGNAKYKGPSTGLDLTTNRPSKLLVGPTDDDSPDVTEEMQRVREECGPFGQKAMERDLDIGDIDDLEHEIRVLRMLVSQQGEYIDQLRRALDNLNVHVEASYTIPTDDE